MFHTRCFVLAGVLQGLLDAGRQKLPGAFPVALDDVQRSACQALRVPCALALPAVLVGLHELRAAPLPALVGQPVVPLPLCAPRCSAWQVRTDAHRLGHWKGACERHSQRLWAPPETLNPKS